MRNILITILVLSSLCAQSAKNPVEISASISSATFRAGEVVNVNIYAEMDNEWHIYSIYELTEGPLPTEISVSGTVVDYRSS